MVVHVVDGGGVEHSLEAQAHVWNHLFRFINSMALKCAVELRISDAIHKHGGRPVTISQLLPELGIPHSKAAFLRRLMRLLTHSGFFTTHNDIGGGEEAYLLTNSSMLLLRDNTHSVGGFILGMLDPWLLTPWQSLSAWFRTSDSPSPFHLANGMSLWEAASQTPELNTLFNESMASGTHLTIDAAVKEHGEVLFRELKSLVDVGGGNGATAMSLAKAFSHLKCTVLDLPHVIATVAAGSRSSSSGSTDQGVEFLAGDMFEHIPPADAILLKWILHDWSDDHCVQILKMCRKAIPPKQEGGKVIVMDMVVIMSSELPHDVRETQYCFDTMMMVLNNGGRERSEMEWQKLFSDAGFSGYKIISRLAGMLAIIEAYY